MDDWNDLLHHQWQEQQTFKQQTQKQQPRRQTQAQPRLQQRGSNQDEIEHKYGGGNTNRNVAVTGGNSNNNGNQLVSRPSSSTGTVARPRSFWDLISFPSWSGLTPQSIRLEWSGTDSSSNEYIVSAFLPDGINTGDVNISMDERTRMLTLKCQQKSHEEEKDNDGHIISSRSSSSHVERTLQVPHDVDISAISASKGQTSSTSSSGSSPQLILHLPKLATPQPQPGVKQITIR
jgi:hypothetical protein